MNIIIPANNKHVPKPAMNIVYGIKLPVNNPIKIKVADNKNIL